MMQAKPTFKQGDVVLVLFPSSDLRTAKTRPAVVVQAFRHGRRLGWFLDPDDFSILGFQPGQEPVLYQGSDRLPMLAGIDLILTVKQIFGWLKMGSI